MIANVDFCAGDDFFGVGGAGCCATMMVYWKQRIRGWLANLEPTRAATAMRREVNCMMGKHELI